MSDKRTTRRIGSPAKPPDSVTKRQVREAIRKVLYRKSSSKKCKIARGSDLTQP